MRVKRWLTLIILGAAIANLGSVCAFRYGVVEWWAALVSLLPLPEHARDWLGPVGLVLIGIGLLTMLVSAYLLVRTVARVIDPEKALRLAEVVNRNRLERILRGHEIVVVGGGTGLSTMIRGLKSRTGNITAIVTVSDDGGSSGRLQRELGILPPGDIRNCLVALADEEPLMTALFNHRFREGEESTGGIGGHSMGNLFLAALTDLNGGRFDLAVQAATRVLAVRGRVLPSTLERISLVADMKDGSRIRGETAIVSSRLGIQQVRLEPAAPNTFPDVAEAIEEASVVVIGPGSVYTSVIPNLLVPKIRAALDKTRAIRIYVCNVMTQPGETDGFTAADHVDAIVTQTGFTGIDYVMVNTKQPGADQLVRYRKQGAEWVKPDLGRIRDLGFEPISGSFISQSNLVRHDADALAREIFRILEEGGGPRKSRRGSAKRSSSRHDRTAGEKPPGDTRQQSDSSARPASVSFSPEEVNANGN
jgi:uncharacterized cofD-like protein